MKNITNSFVIICVIFACHTSVAIESIKALPPNIKEKCQEDNIDIRQAQERLYWAVKCNLLKHAVMDGFLNHPDHLYPVFMIGDKIYPTPVDRNAMCDPQITTEFISDGTVGRIMCPASSFLGKGNMLGMWDGIPSGCQGCIISFFLDNGSTLGGHCANSCFDHVIEGKYVRANMISGQNTRLDKGHRCKTSTSFTITFIDNDTVQYQEQGWNGCGVHTNPGSQIWRRTSKSIPSHDLMWLDRTTPIRYLEILKGWFWQLGSQPPIEF